MSKQLVLIILNHRYEICFHLRNYTRGMKLREESRNVGKKIGLTVLVVTAASVFLVNLPSARAADKSSSYVEAKLGIYAPQGDALGDFDTGFNGGLALGYRKSNYALELEVGYFETKGEGTIVASGPPPVAVPGKANIWVVPVALTYKIVVPLGTFEPFGEVGAGVYVADAELSGAGRSFSDRHTSSGVHIGLGANLNITQRLFLGIEGRYLWAGEHEFVLGQIPVSVKIDGVIATANLGYRFDVPSGR